MAVDYQIQDVESYREAELRFKAVMEIVYAFVLRSERPRMAMQQVGTALGLRSAGQSETELALMNQLTLQGFSKGVVRFLRMAQLPPALRLKSDADKATYRNLRKIS